MATAFISYSTQDVDFAQLCKVQLEAAGIDVWVDQTGIDAGSEWEESIDDGIQSSDALVLIVSPNSSASAYVMYEWAFARGLGVKIIPVLLAAADKHPRLARLQHLDFSVATARNWDALTDAVKAAAQERAAQPATQISITSAEDLRTAREQILAYLDDRGFRIVSFERIRENIDSRYTDEFLSEVRAKHADVFVSARLRGGKVGVKLKHNS